jgi:hypothetical protein
MHSLELGLVLVLVQHVRSSLWDGHVLCAGIWGRIRALLRLFSTPLVSWAWCYCAHHEVVLIDIVK